MPISFHQLRTARSLLDISQGIVADAVGMSAPQLSNYESGVKTAKTETLERLEDFYKLRGIEFTDNDGVRRSASIVILEGTEGFRSFMEDVYETAKNIGGDICLYNTQPEQWIKHLGREWYDMHNKRMGLLGDQVRARITVRENTYKFILDCAEYRWLPKGKFQDVMFYAYGEKLASLSFDNDEVKITVHNDKRMAEGFRVMFDSVWEHETEKP